MNQKKLSKWLKCILAGVGLCGLTMYAAVLPACGDSLRSAYPEFSDRYVPWLIFLGLAGVPCFGVLAIAWKIAVNIGNGLFFTNQNARFFQWISALSAIDAGFFFAGNVLFLLLNMSHPSVMLGSLVVVFLGVAAAVVAAILSYAAQKAAVLQEQSDFTI